METIKKYLRVDRSEISFLKFIFEAYDGLAVLSTVDPESTIVMFQIAPGCEADVDMILQDLKKKIMIEQVAAQSVPSFRSWHQRAPRMH
ncbi:MAG: DUF4911 domain-containing protein [Pseudomonadota bacterium]